VQIRSLYRDRRTVDPHHVHHEDIYVKMATTLTRLATARKQGHLRLEGCPVSVAEQVLALVALSGVKNPYLAPDQIVAFNRGYLGWRARVALNRLRGKKYHASPPGRRGEAAPALDAPA
jgi:hypothetical protein